MAFEPLNWSPASFAQAETDVQNLVLRETHALELKARFDRGDSGNAKLYKALASLANHGGTLVVGVEEDKTLARAATVVRVEIAGEVERIMQVAANLDPPLALPTPRVLEDPAEPTLGVIVVSVPASPMAPHRTPKNGYFARDVRAYPMPDAEVERMIRLRHDRGIAAGDAIDGFIKSVSALLSPEETPTAWFAVAVEPSPAHLPFLLRSRLNDRARSWLDPHLKEAEAKVREMIDANPALASAVPYNWTPCWRHPHPVRIDGGARFTTRFAENSSYNTEKPPKAAVIEIAETGAVRVAENHLNFYNTTVLNWPSLLGAAAWTVGLFQSIQSEAGLAIGATIAVHVGGVQNMTPHVHFGSEEERRARSVAGWQPDPYPASDYRATRPVNGVELAGDIHDALDWLFGQFLRNLGLPDLLYRPPI